MRGLLDVSVLIALLDSDHVRHDAAWRWLRANIHLGWATCPITENGCVRIMAGHGYSNRLPAAEVADRLREATATDYHQFWSDSVSILDPSNISWHQISGPAQITDAYLLQLAVANHGRFVTFDRRISLNTAIGACDRHLSLIE